MNTVLVTLISAGAAIIGAIGTILIARWQHEGNQRVFMTQKIDEIVDERVAEMRADRDEFKKQLQVGEEERRRLFQNQSSLREANALLKSKINEIQLQREQAINRMRRELNHALEKNTVLFAKNAELETQISLLQTELAASRVRNGNV